MKLSQCMQRSKGNMTEYKIRNEDAINLFDLQDDIESLKAQVLYLRQVIHFWHGEVPQKYKKFNPKKGEYPFFHTSEYKVDSIDVEELNFAHPHQMPNVQKLRGFPKTEEEKKEVFEKSRSNLATARKKMREEKKSIPEYDAEYAEKYIQALKDEPI